MTIKRCPLTEWQFGRTKFGFWEYYLRKFGLKISSSQAVLIGRFLIPSILSFLAFYVQNVLKFKPLLF
jgi:hypothetical protein